ncbi:DUF6716 putative glycosyltransferase [Mycetocola sp.]|uniref:DUF6716 putative glycosyltransferase n=1 Tax=Mycetocola sp. TaxID=1871042 RepID=UPI0039895055
MGRKVVGIVDSDSFAKWGASLLDTLPLGWELSLLVVSSALTASPRQVVDAIAGTRFTPGDVRFLTIADVLRDASVERADAVLVACRGPVAEVLLHALSRGGSSRPVLVSGLPGISIPAKWKGIFYRAQADLFVLHSHQEVAAYRELAAEHDTEMEFVLATLPFARSQGASPASVGKRDSVIFAAQAIVPRERADRQRVVDILCELAREQPDVRVVLKVRALPGEEQTHAEFFPLPDLLPPNPPGNLVVESGPMSDHLGRALGFATISSTAVLEAAARKIPSILLNDFGIDALLINEVFADSGLLAPSADLIGLRFPAVDRAWLAENYAHPASDNTFVRRLVSRMAERDSGPLPARAQARRSSGGALRRAWDRRQALGRHDRSVLGFFALLIGWPMFRVRQARRARMIANAER